MKKYKMLYIFAKLICLYTIINQIISKAENVSIFFCFIAFFILDVAHFCKNKIKNDVVDIVSIVLTLEMPVLCIVQNLIDIFYSWDTIMHTTSGFLTTSLFVLLFNKQKISLRFLLFTAFCFSMMIGAMWEIGEFTVDQILHTDTQKDRIVEKFTTGKLIKDKDIKIDNIKYTIIYSIENNEIKETKIDGYIDLGIIDTMKDLIVTVFGSLSGIVIYKIKFTKR